MRALLHVLPYALFVLSALVAEWLGGAATTAVELVRAPLVLALIVVLWRRGARFRPRRCSESVRTPGSKRRG